ncbi:hypothetical protein [Halorubrum ezzemoulense]|uniref:hypothetical protein n=1 Tax=Halorubrum ezzemoulense TaxID=337243 RepID=UPI00232AFF12|nr:hypothetical protein [Halorubrum ezzemoulense]MDB2237581.1 hypothetical protein [Halorubrum ezzemoulense]MDB2248925.1 hypothetical protein [Halorubrum ezzemoulense]
MYPTDERILEHLAEESWASPSTMAAEIEFQQIEAEEEYIQQRCIQLAERELVIPVIENSEMYEITRWGLAYLRGDLDVGLLPRWSVG